MLGQDGRLGRSQLGYREMGAQGARGQESLGGGNALGQCLSLC